MDTRYLQCFIAVAECGSLAEVARRLDLTPAAVAARIKALEQDIGTPLVKRDGRSVKPTEAGLKILERARMLVRDCRDLQAMASDDNALGEFRLGVSTSVQSTLLPKALSPFYARYPMLSVFIEPGTSSHLYHQVTSGMLDAAIIVQPQFAIPKGFEWQLLVEDVLTVLAPVAMKHRAPHEIIETEPFLRYDRSTWGGRMADKYLRKHNLVPKERLEIDGAAAIAVMVAEGLGVSLLPHSIADHAHQDQVIHLSLPHAAPTRRMGLLWASQRAQTSLAQAFLEEAQRASDMLIATKPKTHTP